MESDNTGSPSENTPVELVENEDYYTDGEGLMIFTSKFLLARGFCCHQGCRNCPYPPQEIPQSEK